MSDRNHEITKIVVCEDDAATLDLICDRLAADHYEVLPAPSAADALRLCRHNDPDLLLLDLALPDAAGLDVLRGIREAETPDARLDPRLPIIVLIGRRGTIDPTRGLDLGADDYVQKPFSYEDLRARVTAVLRRVARSERDQGQADDKGVAEGSLTGKVFDTDSNPVEARLLVSGPRVVDGEMCIIAEPTDFFSTAPDPNYEGQDRPTLAADDLRIAVPVRTILSPAAGALLAGLTDNTGEIEPDRVYADPEVWDELYRIFPRGLFDEAAERRGNGWHIPASVPRRVDVPGPSDGEADPLTTVPEPEVSVDGPAADAEESAEGPQGARRPRIDIPEGCTGSTIYGPHGRPSVHHDGGTCPVHEDTETPRTPGQVTADEMAADVGYDREAGDGPDALVHYKKAVEERMISMIDGPGEALIHLRRWLDDPATDGKDACELMAQALAKAGY